ncbi:hypothetical protein C0J52_19109 [Blattella germanica]|nr:hypothetical protein C0J52_19109 [Blattella germanica]
MHDLEESSTLAFNHPERAISYSSYKEEIKVAISILVTTKIMLGFKGDRKYVVVVVVDVVVVVVVEFLSSGVVSSCVTIFWAHLKANFIQ